MLEVQRAGNQAKSCWGACGLEGLLEIHLRVLGERHWLESVNLKGEVQSPNPNREGRHSFTIGVAGTANDGWARSMRVRISKEGKLFCPSKWFIRNPKKRSIWNCWFLPRLADSKSANRFDGKKSRGVQALASKAWSSQDLQSIVVLRCTMAVKLDAFCMSVSILHATKPVLDLRSRETAAGGACARPHLAL